jgi:hypothetical protein
MRCLTLVLALSGCCAAGVRAEQATWDEQNTAMGWFILHISSINAINGLHLTREQAVKLRGLAREIESVAPKVPAFDKAYRPDLGEVRDTYLELRKVLLDGGEPSKELEGKVYRARGIEAAVIRQSLAQPKEKAASCQRCHGEPAAQDVRQQAAATLADLRMSDKANPHETFMAHLLGAFGTRGATKLVQLAAEVDKVLTDPQKEVVHTFSCCLIPPKGLSDPVRAGQAAGGEKEVETLRWARGVPADRWPKTLESLMGRLDQMVAGRSPGATEAERAETRKRVAAVYEKARSMSETEFEMEKDTLAAGLRGKQSNSAGLDAGKQRFMVAHFLLLPGSAEVYDKLVRRLDARPSGEKEPSASL